MLSNKKAAIELSIGTIIIIVLGVSMLILGMVLIRSIMCSAVSLTGDINDKTKTELNRLFGSTDAEVVCIGVGDQAVKLIPGKENSIHCSIKAPDSAEYYITLKEITSSSKTLTSSQLEKWVTTGSWKGQVVPGDTIPKKVVRLNIPDNAPETNLRMQVEISKDGEQISTQDLDFQITRVGIVKSAVC